MSLYFRSWLLGVFVGVIGAGQVCCLSARGARAFTRDQDVHNELDADDTIAAQAGSSIDVDKIVTQVTTTVSNQMWPIMVLLICWVVFDAIKTLGLGWLITRLRYTNEKRKWNAMCGNGGANPPGKPGRTH
jgi:hypothetical protein